MKGYTFNRQKPLTLVIEVDGGYHFGVAQQLKDRERQSVVEDLGLHFLRFDDAQLQKDMDVVLEKIETYINRYESNQV